MKILYREDTGYVWYLQNIRFGKGHMEVVHHTTVSSQSCDTQELTESEKYTSEMISDFFFMLWILRIHPHHDLQHLIETFWKLHCLYGLNYIGFLRQFLGKITMRALCEILCSPTTGLALKATFLKYEQNCNIETDLCMNLPHPLLSSC